MNGRPRLLDLFCGGGGAAVGYHRAGFDVVGVDIALKKLPDGSWADDKAMPAAYPFQFIKADVFDFLDKLADDANEPHWGWLLGDFDAIHASPPCQDHSVLGVTTKQTHGTGWMLGATRDRLQELGQPWVIENVPPAPMRPDFKLCGCMFGLADSSGRQLYRERWFETSWHAFDLRAPCHHAGRPITVAGHGAQGGWEYVDGVAPTQEDRKRAMGIDWMNRDHLGQAIPPAFTEVVGASLLEHLSEAAA